MTKCVTEIREYCESLIVEVDVGDDGRLVVRAFNESGYNSTEVDLLDVLEWVRQHRPELLCDVARQS